MLLDSLLSKINMAKLTLSNDNPSPINSQYERQAEPVIELQLEKAAVRLAHLLNDALH